MYTEWWQQVVLNPTGVLRSLSAIELVAAHPLHSRPLRLSGGRSNTR